MKTAIDDLPAVSASRLRALGDIMAEMKTATVKFDDMEFVVALSLRRFPNGGSWSFFLCPCGRTRRSRWSRRGSTPRRKILRKH